MVGWWLDGHEFEQALGNSGGQGSLGFCSSWGHKELGHNWATEQQRPHHKPTSPSVQFDVLHSSWFQALSLTNFPNVNLNSQSASQATRPATSPYLLASMEVGLYKYEFCPSRCWLTSWVATSTTCPYTFRIFSLAQKSPSWGLP